MRLRGRLLRGLLVNLLVLVNARFAVVQKCQQQTGHHAQRGNRHGGHHADVFHAHTGLFDIGQKDFVQENRTEAIRQEHICRYQTEGDDAGQQAAVDLQAVKHQQKRRYHHGDEGNVDGNHVLAHHTHRQQTQQQAPFHKIHPRRNAVLRLTAVDFTDNGAGNLLWQAGVRNCHRKRAEHGVRKRNARAARQTVLEMRHHALLGNVACGIHHIGQRKACR